MRWAPQVLDALPEYRQMRVNVCNYSVASLAAKPGDACEMAQSWRRQVTAGLRASRSVNHGASIMRFESALAYGAASGASLLQVRGVQP